MIPEFHDGERLQSFHPRLVLPLRRLRITSKGVIHLLTPESCFVRTHQKMRFGFEQETAVSINWLEEQREEKHGQLGEIGVSTFSSK
jgi:hypothetical protein